MVEDADGYERSVHGVSIRSVRTGLGFGANDTKAITGASSLVMDVHTGFPMINRTIIDDSRFTATYIRRAPPGASWCRYDLGAGSAVLYGPEAKHVGVNPAGLSFAFVAADLEVIEAMAEDLQLPVALPQPGSVTMRRSERAGAFGKALAAFIAAAQTGGPSVRSGEEDLLYRVAALFANKETAGPDKRTRMIDRVTVANACVEYAEAVRQVPSIPELCRVSGVSERTLRVAFVETFGVSPSRFFRMWALNEARSRLLAGAPAGITVSRVAADLGLLHLGRFAGRYRHLHGETPSATLRLGKHRT